MRGAVPKWRLGDSSSLGRLAARALAAVLTPVLAEGRTSLCASRRPWTPGRLAARQRRRWPRGRRCAHQRHLDVPSPRAARPGGLSASGDALPRRSTRACPNAGWLRPTGRRPYRSSGFATSVICPRRRHASCAAATGPRAPASQTPSRHRPAPWRRRPCRRARSVAPTPDGTSWLSNACGALPAVFLLRA